MDICPCNICPYQDYISCYWLDCNQTSKQAFWDHLKQMSTVMVKFVHGTFDLATFVHISNISILTKLFLPKIFFGP